MPTLALVVLLWTVPGLPVAPSVECLAVESAQPTAPRVFMAQADGWREESAQAHRDAIAHCVRVLRMPEAPAPQSGPFKADR